MRQKKSRRKDPHAQALVAKRLRKYDRSHPLHPAQTGKLGGRPRTAAPACPYYPPRKPGYKSQHRYNLAEICFGCGYNRQTGKFEKK